MNLEEVKKEFEKQGIAYPRKKSNGKWGLRGSTLIATETEEQAVIETIQYVEQVGIPSSLVNKLKEKL